MSESPYSHELTLPDAEICARYTTGESAYRLGKEYGGCEKMMTSRSAILDRRYAKYYGRTRRL